MLSPLYFQIPIFFLLMIGAYQDYKTRTISNKIIFAIAIFSLPLIVTNKSFLLPVGICILFLVLFYFSDKIEKINTKLFTNPIGGADTKVFIPLLLQMSTYDIFIFFFLFAVANTFVIFKFKRDIPMFIPILFGYFGLVAISLLQIVIRIISNAYP